MNRNLKLNFGNSTCIQCNRAWIIKLRHSLAFKYYNGCGFQFYRICKIPLGIVPISSILSLFSATQQVTDKKGRVLYHVMLGSCGEIPVCINSKVAKLGGSQSLFLNLCFASLLFNLFLWSKLH